MTQVSYVPLDDTAHSVSRRGEPLVGSMSCLFSSSITQRVGSGMTSARHTSTTYWFIRQLTEISYGVRSVDARSLPWGDENVISEEELIARYVPEPTQFEELVLPAVRLFRFRLKGDDFSGFGYASSDIRLDEANMRSLFSICMEYLNAGKKREAKTTFHELLNIKQGFTGKNQFMFNDFGIALRKAGLYSTAVTSYRKGLDYTLVDDHLYYNLARAHYEQGQWWECIEALGKCFEHNPELTVGKWLVELIVALSKDHALLRQYDKPPVPKGVASRALILSEAVQLTPPPTTATSPGSVKAHRRIWHGINLPDEDSESADST